ncbi:MAG: hypothetical protein ACYC3L_01360 [Gemmatimonadaceae bacterium]
MTTGTSDVNVAWRKVQGKVAEGAEFFSPEWNWYDDYPLDAIDWSLRETTIPIDLVDEIGAGFLPEGGKLMRPSSVNMTDLTVPLTQLNARFTASKLAKYANKGMANQVETQLKMQATKKVQAMARKFSIHTKGTSVGTIFLTDTDIPAATSVNGIVPKDGFGLSDVDNLTYLTSLVKVNERIAFVDGSSLSADSFGYIDTVTAATSIDVTFNTTATANTNNSLKVIGAASLENTTIAGTDYNIAFNGWADFLTSTNLHGIATSSYANWDVGSDTTGGRLTSDRIWKAAHTIENNGGGNLNTIELSQGVYRDLVKSEGSLVRHDSPKGMEIDGSVKMSGVQWKMSKYSLPQYAICYDRKSYKKVALLPKPEKAGGLTWSDGKELIDDDGYVFEVNMVVGLFCTNRANTYYLSGLTES